ncbi:McrB family protein [Flavobacterium microcysteis]|uniref:ScoMcrA-like N-terminal head domain-containing protein n=1 Tax=Flavobacterium microcysteis TaxID=2596891 RepID=A0A501Q4L8_9FLAO|nr:hypothetical protein [Flavobacterium microcysteis]TPD67305.1 hypothetical protein FJA49_13620 [Flavobacterium microcysteis]
MKIDFTQGELIKAIKQIDSNPDLKRGRHSSRYDLIYKGAKYPPILVLSVANEFKGGKEITLSDFKNNIEIPFKILRDKGFEVKEKSLNNQKDYIEWSKRALSIQTSTKQQYVTSIENLSKIVGYNIFERNNLNEIIDLYEDLLKEQKNKGGKYYEEERPSASLKGWYSASVKTYVDFLKARKEDTNIGNNLNYLLFNQQEFIQSIRNSGLNFDPTIVIRFIASLLTKPFVLLTGLSGSGKTKIAQSFVQWICEDDSQYKIIPVGADWTNREPLLGYPNGLSPEEYILPDSGVLNIIIEASKDENQHKPYFLILDEMNLSHVERYFADFLSVMESEDKIMLYCGTNRKSPEGVYVPPFVDISKNLFIIGTVNIDETTYMFSPKVLDRANTIEFRIDEASIKSFFRQPSTIDLSVLKSKGASTSENFLKLASDNHIVPNDIYADIFVKFFNELKKTGAEFGYRTAFEMLLLMKKLSYIGTFSDNECIDIAVMQKLLPKLHGSRSKIAKVLDALILLCLKDGQSFSIAKNEEISSENILYPITFEKLVRMYKNALDNGFTSYAEA